MKNTYNINFELSNFLKQVKFKKHYIKTINDKILDLKIKKDLNIRRVRDYEAKTDSTHLIKVDNVIVYIISIHYSNKNTLMHVSDFAGNIKFFYSSGSFNFKGKRKANRFNVFKHFFQVLISKMKFLEGKPIALHLKNVGPNKTWIVKQLKTKFFITVVKNFNLYPYNGCRKRKVRRKKFKRNK